MDNLENIEKMAEIIINETDDNKFKISYYMFIDFDITQSLVFIVDTFNDAQLQSILCDQYKDYPTGDNKYFITEWKLGLLSKQYKPNNKKQIRFMQYINQLADNRGKK